MVGFTERKNVYSQDGEDSIIEDICSHLGIEAGYFCEFGAWDGVNLSNCRALFERGWSGIFIEGDKSKFNDLQRTYSAAENIIRMNSYVTSRGENSLDAIFCEHNIANIDLLSIDIDSDDLLIWKSLRSVRPKIVIIEYNFTIPFDTRYENPPGEMKGNSALSICEFANKEGYVLVAGTNSNLFFIDKHFAVAETPEMSLISLREGLPSPRFFFGYDATLIADHYGTAKVNEVFYIPWTTTLMTQPLPQSLRGHTENAGGVRYVRWLLSRVSTLLRRPASMLRWWIS